MTGGTMGAGKTATCQILKQKLDNSVFLDGDWCWDMHPFQVTQETKKMVLENIAFLLNNVIHCPVYENIIFCRVMHEQGIIDDILTRLDTSSPSTAGVEFINCLKHTKGRWRGQSFKLLPWQDSIIQDVFGTVKENGFRQYNTAYVEIPKKNGKSELAAGVSASQQFLSGTFCGGIYKAWVKCSCGYF